MTLEQLSNGMRARIRKLPDDNRTFRKKLLALGMLPGAEISLVRSAPLGDPLQFSVAGSSVALRKSDAALIQIEAI